MPSGRLRPRCLVLPPALTNDQLFPLSFSTPIVSSGNEGPERNSSEGLITPVPVAGMTITEVTDLTRGGFLVQWTTEAFLSGQEAESLPISPHLLVFSRSQWPAFSGPLSPDSLRWKFRPHDLPLCWNSIFRSSCSSIQYLTVLLQVDSQMLP